MYLPDYLESRQFLYKEFSNLIGVSVSTLSNYICKKRLPPLDIAIRIEDVTKGKVTPRDLLHWWEDGDER